MGAGDVTTVEPTFCSNTNCLKSRVHMGGKFRMIAGKWYCDGCQPNMDVLSPGRNLWDFETTHLTGQPIHVKSLSHLRQLERQYGVSSHAANHMERNWNATPSQR